MVIDTASETTQVSNGWENGPWRKIQPGENPDPKYILLDSSGEKIIPERIYGHPTQSTAQQHNASPDLIPTKANTNLRLSKGAARLINEANHLGIDPAPYLEQTHPKPGAKVPVKGPLARLRESVQTKIASIRR